jgi:tRNA(Ile)-lysidine synthase
LKEPATSKLSPNDTAPGGLTPARGGAGEEIEPAVARVLCAPGSGPVVLAISGGADSMALMAAAAAVAPERVAVVATFDHGTGAAARRAVAHVADAARRLGLPVEVGRAPTPLAERESAWREARWTFLRGVASAHGRNARVATAHTRDDQIETVVLRLLRHAGARGLAALYADTGILRPLLDVPGAATVAYLRAREIRWIEDPSNLSRAHLRNRVRLDLLPVLRRVRPGLDADLLRAARVAAEWRAAFERVVDAAHPVQLGEQGVLGSVAAPDLAGYDPKTLAVLWPVLAARAGVTLDRRGTSRLAQFTTTGRVGGVIQLSGGIEVVRTRFSFVFRRREASRD